MLDASPLAALPLTSMIEWFTSSTAIDGLLGQQVELDIQALEQAIGRTFTGDERDGVRTHQERSYRWTFIVSGLGHPSRCASSSSSPPPAPAKVAAAAAALLA